MGYLYGSPTSGEAPSYLVVKRVSFHFAFMKGTQRGSNWPCHGLTGVFCWVCC